jgi:Na+-driven multidrug efflux pump
VAEPLFLLADTAIVGHLGTPELAGLAIAGTVLQTVVGLAVFLAYGTTASVARHLGADDLAGALRTGLSGVWLALVLGTLAALGCAAGSDTIIGWFGTSDAVDVHAEVYLRVSAFGIPAMLVVLATTGILRGLQDTRPRWWWPSLPTWSTSRSTCCSSTASAWGWPAPRSAPSSHSGGRPWH